MQDDSTRILRLWFLLVLVASVVAFSGCAGDGAVAEDDDLIHVSCFQSPPPGRCQRRYPAFYFDYASDTCRSYAGGVCDGRWPFQSMRDCVSACGGRPLR